MSVYALSSDFVIQSVPPKPIKVEGVSVQKFLPGWHPKLVYAGLAPIHLLLFEHDDSAWAIWFLDQDMNRMGGAVDELSPGVRTGLLASCSTLFGEIWNALVVSPGPPRLTEVQQSFLQLPVAIRLQMLDLYLSSFDLATRYGSISDPTNLPDGGKLVYLGDPSIALEPTYLHRIFNPSFLQDAYVALLNTGAFISPSPIDGRELQATHAFYLGGNRFAYRMIDEAHDVTFYLVADEIYFRIACIYLPQVGLALALDPIHLQQQMPDLSRAMLRHVVEHGKLISAYLQRPAREVVHAWRGLTAMHLGHVLWNDLSGISNLVASVPAQRLPRFLVFDSEFGPEMYGPLDRIFPEIDGKVVRDTGTFGAAIPSFYRDCLLLIKATGLQVSRSMRERIVDMLLRSPDNAAYIAECKTAAARDAPIMLLGLRTENRTLTDLPGFCERLVGFLIQQIGQVTLVIDGHNSRSEASNQFLWSHGEAQAARSPMSVELEILSILQSRAAGTGVEIVSTIGAPLVKSLIWGCHSNFFVTFWGAGLAKYRWVCNKPGLVITSNWNLQHFGDLHIYDDPQFQESPAPIEFIEQSAVYDRPDAPLLVNLGTDHNPSIMNFDLDERITFRAIFKLLQRHTDVSDK